MKHLTKFLSMAILLSATLFLFSCGEDDEPVIDVGDGLAVADGYYFVQEGEEPIEERALLPEKVEGEANAPTDREGFFGNYVFLQAGNYQLQKVEGREVVSTIGGKLQLIPGDSLSGDEPTSTGYQLALLEEGDEQITIDSDGLFKISYDETLSELIVMEVQNVSLRGNATPNGWENDTQLDIISANADEGIVAEVTGLTMREGEYKVRINNSWKIVRNNDAGTGYVAFTNYGGSAENLVPGGGNIAFDEADEGVYTVRILLTNDGGASFEATKTGTVEPITFDPDDYQFGILGSVTANGFDADRNMFYKGIVNEAHTWYGVVYFAEESVDDQGRRFKIRTNDDWAFNLGGPLTLEGEAQLTVNGPDITAPAAGAYYITLSTADEGDTWTATMKDFGWALIGEGSPTASWEQDVEMTANGFSEGITTYSYTGNFDGRGFKFRAGGEWQFDLGGAIPDLTIGGGDLSVEAGDYEVVLSFDGTNYSAVFTAQ